MKQLEVFHALLHNSIPLEAEKFLHFEGQGRLDFAADFVQDICSGKKTMTLRSVNDVQNDTNSTLGQIRPMSVVQATSEGRVFGLLFIQSVKPDLLFSHLTQDIAEKEGFDTLEQLQSTLRHFYPDLHPHSLLIQLQFSKVT